MGFSISPVTVVTEEDLTATIPAVATSIGGVVGEFSWGPVDEVFQVVSENELVQYFGTPSSTNKTDWYSAKNFLSYSSDLKVVRVIGSSSLNAGDTGTGIFIKNGEHFDSSFSTIDANANAFIAKYPGEYGNDISVDVTNNAGFDSWAYRTSFEYKPTGTEVAIAVLYKGNIVETFLVDMTVGSKDSQGRGNYITNVINTISNYVWVNVDTDGAGADAGFDGTPGTFTLSGGLTDDPTSGDRQAGWDLYAPADVDVNLLIMGNATNVDANYIIQNVAEVRRDCVAFVGPQYADVVNVGVSATIVSNEIADRDAMTSSSYGIYCDNYKYQYDKYNDVYFWTNLTGDVAGLCARNDQQNDPWISPAGYTKGQIKNVVKMTYTPQQSHRDSLYKNGINPILTFPGRGTILFGDKTMLSRPSAFDRINVRRLFIVIEKAIATSADNLLFEVNDSFTRNLFRNQVEPFLRDVQGRRGVYDFKVIADETNNTPTVIDRNEFVGDIYIKPSRSINFVYLNFVAVATGVVFEEILA